MESPFASPQTSDTSVPDKRTNLTLAAACFWSSLICPVLCFLCIVVYWHWIDGPYYMPPRPWYVEGLGLLIPLLALATQVLGVIFWRSVWHLPSNHVWIERGTLVGFAMFFSLAPLALGLFGLTMTMIAIFSSSVGPVVTMG